MTVASETSKSGPYAGAGTTGPFTVGFRFLDETHLRVIKTSTTGIDSDLTLTTDYTVAGVGNETGSVTLVTALASGEKLTIVRDVPFVQQTDYLNNDAFPAESHENALDLLTMQTQQIKERVDAALTLPATTSGVSTQLPTPEANKLIGWDSVASGLQNYDTQTLATIVAFGTANADLFDGDGVTTQFTLSDNPGALNNLDVSIGGATQTPGLDYTWTSGTTITFTSAPPAGTDNVLVRYMQALPQGAGDSGAIEYTPTGGASTNVEAHLQYTDAKWVSPKDSRFGAVGDGVTDDSAALQAWLNCGSKLLYWDDGQYLVSAATAQALSVATYAHGDATLEACLIVPAGVTILTAGTATQLIVDTPAADTCAIAIAEDTAGSPTTHSQITTTIGRFMLRAKGANGRYGIVTPAKALLLSDKRPRYSLDVHFAPPPGNDNNTISTYGWDYGIMMGDTVDARVNYSGYGTYNATAADAGQHQMTGMKVNSVAGAYGVSVRFQCSNMRTFFEGGDGLEGFSVTDFEGQGGWFGIVLSNASGEPGGYIDNGHVNANKEAYKFSNRTSLQVGKVEAYRSDAYHNHGGEWNGISMDACGKVTIGSLHVLHGTLLTKTGTNGVKASGTSTFVCEGYQINSVANGFRVDASPDCVVGNGVVNSVDTLFNLSGAGTADFIGGDVMVRAGALAYWATDGAVDKKRLRFPRNSGITVRTHQDISISAAGSTTIKPRETATEFDVTMTAGAGAFTYDLILDRVSSVVGDVVRVKIFGSSSANPTLRICDNSTATVLSSFNSLGGTTRLIAEYRLNESGNWVERYVFTSTELTY